MRLFSLPLFFFSLSAYPYSLRCSPPPTIGGLPPAWPSAASPIGHRRRSPGRNLFLQPPTRASALSPMLYSARPVLFHQPGLTAINRRRLVAGHRFSVASPAIIRPAGASTTSILPLFGCES
uniref:Secreted protein n=1 Tax=Opuntia streptacantha TaxID=393608 RepID=A0A7C9DBG4_OPUST